MFNDAEQPSQTFSTLTTTTSTKPPTSSPIKKDTEECPDLPTGPELKILSAASTTAIKGKTASPSSTLQIDEALQVYIRS